MSSRIAGRQQLVLGHVQRLRRDEHVLDVAHLLAQLTQIVLVGSELACVHKGAVRLKTAIALSHRAHDYVPDEALRRAELVEADRLAVGAVY